MSLPALSGPNGKRKLKKQRGVDPILAAGGIVRGEGANAGKIILVRRRRYGGDVGLPKGKKKDKEDLRTTALREVKEETGYDAEIVKYAGKTRYRAGRRPKEVSYYIMKVSASSAPKPVDGGEIDAVEWMTPSDARARLTHSKDRNLIAAVFNLPRKYNPHPAEDPHRHRDAPMANDGHLALLKQGAAAWNAWRDKNPNIDPDLREADLRGANLRRANLRRVNLSEADISEAELSNADLRGANLRRAKLWQARLREANLRGADLSRANLIGTNLRRVNLRRANLSEANIRRADLRKADLTRANLRDALLGRAHILDVSLTKADLRGASLEAAALVDTDLTGADLTGSYVYGISAWRLKLENAKQQNLVITRDDEPAITVDNIEIAQFIYLMLNNEKVRDAIDTITSKAVLILGRFTQERKPVLEALREELRQRKYLPILFDFEKPRSRNTDETITLLARMARFVVADISDAKSVLQELRAIVPDLPSVPVQPIILAMQEEPGMFDFYRNMPWFLNVHRYASQEQLIADLGEKVIRPAELKVLDLQGST
jgi:uncharacterized protein YjbI with pentapeptide repeats/8-oxo-dGTP pyrophosphatase MutT (NUDIX family)